VLCFGRANTNGWLAGWLAGWCVRKPILRHDLLPPSGRSSCSRIFPPVSPGEETPLPEGRMRARAVVKTEEAASKFPSYSLSSPA